MSNEFISLMLVFWMSFSRWWRGVIKYTGSLRYSSRLIRAEIRASRYRKWRIKDQWKGAYFEKKSISVPNFCKTETTDIEVTYIEDFLYLFFSLGLIKLWNANFFIVEQESISSTFYTRVFLTKANWAAFL